MSLSGDKQADNIDALNTISRYFDVFYLILYIPSTIFQLCRDGSSCVEPVLS